MKCAPARDCRAGEDIVCFLLEAMKPTKKHMLLAAAAVLAAMSLVIDRVVIGYDLTEPSEASAEQATDALSALQQATHGTPGPTKNPVTEHLKGFSNQAWSDSGDEMKDAFRAPAGWFDQGRPVDSEEPAVFLPDPVTEFVHRHRLEAVMMTGSGGYAILDGEKVIRTGQRVDGFTLVSLTKREAVFRSGDSQVVLAIESGRPAGH
jgi:hypothetical protein